MPFLQLTTRLVELPCSGVNKNVVMYIGKKFGLYISSRVIETDEFLLTLTHQYMCIVKEGLYRCNCMGQRRDQPTANGQLTKLVDFIFCIMQKLVRCCVIDIPYRLSVYEKISLL